MNYWADEGLDLTVQALDGGSQSVAAVKAGRAEFATQGTSTLYSSVDDGVALKGFMCEIPDSFELVAVLKESPIKSFSQLKGATIGVNAVGGSPDLTIRAVAALRGWEVGKGKDIEVLAVGTGVPALNALKTNKIQALALWSTPFATLSAQTGAKFRFFRPPPIPDLGFTHATLAMDKTMKDDPKLVASFSRAVAKSLVFMAAADPVELTKLHYKLYPAVKPTGISAAKAVDLGVGTIKATTKYMDFESRVFKQKTPLGAASADVIKANAKLYEKAGTISEVQPAKAYFTKRFIADANDFDFEPIIEKAKKFKVSPD